MGVNFTLRYITFFYYFITKTKHVDKFINIYLYHMLAFDENLFEAKIGFS